MASKASVSTHTVERALSGVDIVSLLTQDIYTGHRDGLYQTALAERLPFTSFRFDLSGHGESEGDFNVGHIAVRWGKYMPAIWDALLMIS